MTAVAVLQRRNGRAQAAALVAEQGTVVVKGELASLRRELAVSNDELAARENDLAAARAEAAEQLAQAREQLAEAQEQLGALQLDLEAQRLEVERVTAQWRDATSEHDAASFWALEMQRSERTWRHHVAPGFDLPCPLVGSVDPLRTAVEIEAAALREESGTGVDVEWSLERSLDPAARLAVLRQVQEQLARFAKRSDRVIVRVSDGGDHVVAELMPAGALDPADLGPVVLRIACEAGPVT
ncbi:MAG: hypothetical protein JWL70_2128 [Acidimicrobiia bacterium]|nr:hypothetical protein [Acidimicrobiia bacterium]